MRHAPLLIVAVTGYLCLTIATPHGAPAPRQTPAAGTLTYLGPNECLNCHDHDRENDWYEHREIGQVQSLFPEKGANAGHINSLRQLDTPKSDTFAKAIGLADKYDVNGACVRCHATVFGGDANAGVSCESCHGPASAYNQPHRTPGSYDVAVAQYGMTRLVGNIQGWTQQCTNCHVMDDERLIQAGHPSGDDFDLSKKYVPVSGHFKKSYTADAVAAVAKNEMAGILRRRQPGTNPPEPPPAPAPDTAATAAPPATPPPAPVTPPATTTTSAAPPVTVAAPASAPAPTTVAAPASPKPRPKPSAPKPVAVPAIPPAGSPTSIEPPPPLPDTAPAAAPAAASSAPASTAGPVPTAPEPAPAAPDNFFAQNWIWIAAAILVLVVAAAALKMRGKA